MPNVIIDPFHRAIKVHLDAAIEQAVDELSNGSAAKLIDDAATTGEKYAAQVARIRTLRLMLALCEQVSEEIIRPAKVNVEDR